LFPIGGMTEKTPVNVVDLSIAKKLIKENQQQNALDILLPLAEQNNAEAQNLVGELYHFGGEGLLVDFQKAHTWYLKAFQNGNGEAANHLGRLYLNGEGVPKDPQEAIKWYKQSMLKGDLYGEMNYYSFTNPAFVYILKRAISGDPEAQNIAGELYHFGMSGIERDYDKARSWYLKAVSQGNKAAANHLGRIYLNGEGVPKDPQKAEEWYKKAGG